MHWYDNVIGKLLEGIEQVQTAKLLRVIFEGNIQTVYAIFRPSLFTRTNHTGDTTSEESILIFGEVPNFLIKQRRTGGRKLPCQKPAQSIQLSQQNSNL